MVTPLMGLVLPDVLITLGPQWASDVNDAFSRVDTHDHTTGKGTKVPISAVTINSAIDMQSAYDLINARSLRFVNHSAVLSLPTDIGAIYESGGNLWYNNSTGTPVQITSGAGLAFASLGTIGGDYGPGNPAEVTYSGLTFTYIFTQSPGIAGHIACGDVYVYEPVASGKYVRLHTKTGLASDVNVQLPDYDCVLAGQTEATPVGAVMDFAGSTAPTGWLLCFGQVLNAVANPQYAPLYSVIGNTYGGTDNTDFQVPDCRDKTTVGRGDMGGTPAGLITSAVSGIDTSILGAVGGSQTMLHTHAGPSHTHSDGTLVAETMPANEALTNPEDDIDALNVKAHSWVATLRYEGQTDPIIGASKLFDKAVAVKGSTGSAGTGATGGASDAKNVQPIIVFNKIIKL